MTRRVDDKSKEISNYLLKIYKIKYLASQVQIYDMACI